MKNKMTYKTAIGVLIDYREYQEGMKLTALTWRTDVA